MHFRSGTSLLGKVTTYILAQPILGFKKKKKKNLPWIGNHYNVLTIHGDTVYDDSVDNLCE